jgi:hypothetical protein
MATRSPEGGDKPHNQRLSEFKVLPEQKGVGPRVQKPEEPKQQLSDAELAAKQLLGKHWGATVFEGPFRVPRPFPSMPSEQRGEAKPFQPISAEQQAAERLGKPPPESAEQEIEAILPSYIREMDSDDREGISYNLVPEKELLKEMGWDNFAEYSLDLSSLLPKPEGPIITLDYETRMGNRLLSERLTANEWESTTIKELEAKGYNHRIPKFKEEMQEYRKAVKATVEAWRNRGLL